MNSQTLPRRAMARLVVAMLASIPFAGCGSTPAPTAADPEAAKQLLERALSAWQKGQTVEAVQSATPPIVINERKWSGGSKLTKYEIEVPSKPSGAQQKFRVTLWLNNDKGEEKKEVAQYEVGTTPVNTVFRAMFE